MSVLLGLTAAAFWGVADFAARFSSRRVGAYRTLLYMQFVGFLLMTIFLELGGGITRGVAPGWRPWALAACAGVLNTISSLSLYYSFQIGAISVAAPISSSYPALTVALALASGERVQPLRAAGLAVTLVGVVLAAITFSTKTDESGAAKSSQAHLAKGVGWAIVSAIGFGVLFWFLGFHVVPLTGSQFSVWMIRLSTFLTLLVVAIPARRELRVPIGNVWLLFIAVGATDTIAFVANNTAMRVGQVSLASVLASLYGAVTVLLSWIFLREPLDRTQWLGIGLIFVGIVLVSL
jgi:drug/metabolite transporter (DMT)-like permease